MVELETAEIRKELLRCTSASVSAAVTSSCFTAKGVNRSDESVPRGFLCSITLRIMKDPVIAADGFRSKLAQC